MNIKDLPALDYYTPLLALGVGLRAKRKQLGLYATATAEAAGISRVTLHRIEKGEPGVAMGAYFNVAKALGLEVGVLPKEEVLQIANLHDGWIPARIRLEDYPQLKLLAWQVHGVDTLTPVEALGVYKRNKRHIDEKNTSPNERALMDALSLALDNGDTGI